MKRRILTYLIIALMTLTGAPKMAVSNSNDIAGMIFGTPVPRQNYYFVLKLILTFQSPWGGIPRNREDLKKRIWDEMILSYEAHRRNITVERREIDEKIGETLKESQVAFNWLNEPQAYEQWIRDNLNGTIEEFENQMRHLVQIKKLHEQVRNSIDPRVTQEEAFQEFLNENNNLSVEVAEFEELIAAQEFYDKVMKNPDHWIQASIKDKSYAYEDRSFHTPGFVALEFLMEMWKFPKKAVFDMIEMEPGAFYPPAPIYKGYGVFKVQEIRRADESIFPKRKESYFDQLRMKKKYQGFKDWLEKIKKDADIEVFIEPPLELFQ